MAGPKSLVLADVVGHILFEARADHVRDSLADAVNLFVVVDRSDDRQFDRRKIGLAYACVDFADLGVYQTLDFSLNLFRPDIGEGELRFDQLVDSRLVERVVANQFQNLGLVFVAEVFHFFGQFAALYITGQLGIPLSVGNECCKIDIFQFVGNRLKGGSVGLQFDFTLQVIDLAFQVVDVVVVVFTTDTGQHGSGQEHS